MKKQLYQILFLAFSMPVFTPIFAQEVTFDYRDEGVVHINPFGAGFIAGTNGYGDLGKYQRFDLGNGISLNAVTIFLGHKEIIGGADTVYVVLRSAPDTMPGNTIVTIELTLDHFAEPGLPTRIEMPGPIAFSTFDEFYVGLEWDATGDDQFCILADKAGQGQFDRAWEQYSDGSFHSFNEDSPFSWHLETDLHIQIHYPEPVGTNNFENSVAKNLETLPNPASDATLFSFELKTATDVLLEIFDFEGRLVSTLLNQKMQAGKHTTSLQTDFLNPGNYAVRLRTDGQTMSQLFSIVR